MDTMSRLWHGYKPGEHGTVWKVLRKVVAGGPWKSGWAPNPGRVMYIPRVKVMRPAGQGPLAAFAHRKYAEDFVSGVLQIAHESHYFLGVFEAEATISRDKALWTVPSKQDCFDQFPSTTVLCDDITLRDLVRCYHCNCYQCKDFRTEAEEWQGRVSSTEW